MPIYGVRRAGADEVGRHPDLQSDWAAQLSEGGTPPSSTGREATSSPSATPAGAIDRNGVTDVFVVTGPSTEVAGRTDARAAGGKPATRHNVEKRSSAHYLGIVLLPSALCYCSCGSTHVADIGAATIRWRVATGPWRHFGIVSIKPSTRIEEATEQAVTRNRAFQVRDYVGGD